MWFERRKRAVRLGVWFAFGCCATSTLVSAQANADVDCETLLANPDTSLDEAVAAGCPLSAEQVSRMMDNPVGELITMPLQWDRTSVREPFTGSNVEVDAIKTIPTLPLRLGRNWSLVNRVAISRLDVPVQERTAGLGVLPEQPILAGEGAAGPSPIVPGSTTGLGDIAYVGLVTPKEPPTAGQGTLIWAVGPTLIAPTASEDLLGQGKWQAGPAVAVGYLGKKWTLGLLAQHWWSVAGDDDRPSISQSALQYFWSRRLPHQWALGASPVISLDWSGSDDVEVKLPLGIGISKTVVLGKLPARFALEASHYVDRDDDAIAPDWAARFSVTAVVPSAFLRRKR